MSGNKGQYRIGTGATSLLMVLVILCLTVMSVLACTAAGNEESLQQRRTGVALAMRRAQNTCWQITAQIDTALVQRRTEGSDLSPAEYLTRAGVLPEGAQTEEDTVSFAVPATDMITMQVTLRLYSEGTRRFSITRFTSVSGGDALFDNENYLEVWQ